MKTTAYTNSYSKILLLASAAFVIATLLFFVAGGRPAQAAFPGANGKISFTTNRDGNYEIYSMDADGSNQTKLTSSSAEDDYSSFSPDGKKIVFASRRDNDQEIYVMDADGTNQTRLTTSPGQDRSPSFSPDGSKIAFVSNRDTDPYPARNNDEIYVMNADGTGVTRLTTNSGLDYSPVFSPDGSKIAFASNRDGNFEIYTMNAADGTGLTRLTTNSVTDSSPSFSPDGTKIAFQSNLDIHVMNSDGSYETSLTTNRSYEDASPSFSPDGKKIVFRSDRAGNWNYEIYTMNPDGSNQTRLTTDPSIDDAPSWGATELRSDTSAPKTTATLTPQPNADGWNNTDVTVSLDAADEAGGSGVKEIFYSASGAKQIDSATAAGASAQVSIGTEGETTISYFATDNALNAEMEKSLTVKVDKGAPETAFDSGPDGTSNDNTPTFGFGGSDNLTARADLLYSYKVDDGTWSDYAADTSVTLGEVSGLADGPHTLYVRAEDRAGNEDATPASRTFTVDTAAPAAPVIESPADNSSINATPTLSGTAEANTILKVYDGSNNALGETTADASGNWSFTVPAVKALSEGPHSITSTATDSAGNTSSASAALNLTVDTTAPTVTSVSPASDVRTAAPSTNAEVVFSEAMDPRSLTQTTFYLVKQGSITPITASVTYDAATKKATLDPSADLTWNTSYTVTVRGGSGGAKDVAGNPLTADRASFFATRDPSAPCTITGTARSDTLQGTTGDDVICGLDGADRIIGNGGNDILRGGDGNDGLFASAGDDLYQGGAGKDWASFDQVTQGVRASLEGGSATGQGTDSLIGIEYLNGSTMDDVLVGDSADNQLRGGGGNDTLRGGDGNDRLYASAGNDVYDGGAGTDWAHFDQVNQSVRVYLSLGSATGQGTDSLTGIENLVGSTETDILIGDSGSNALTGGGGDDQLIGREGNDTLRGDGGNDRLLGRQGDDWYNGGAGTDTVDFYGGQAVVASLISGSATGQGSDSLIGIENLEGSDWNDTLIGDSQRNYLMGYQGSDIIRGGDGDDRLWGDVSTWGYVTWPDDDVIRGGDGDDRLWAGAGNDEQYGEGGNDDVDSRDGIQGNDRLDGGPGTDTKETDATEASIVGFP